MRTPVPFLAVVSGVEYGYFDFVGCHVFHPCKTRLAAPICKYAEHRCDDRRASEPRGALFAGLSPAARFFSPTPCFTTLMPWAGNDQQEQVEANAGIEPARPAAIGFRLHPAGMLPLHQSAIKVSETAAFPRPTPRSIRKKEEIKEQQPRIAR